MGKKNLSDKVYQEIKTSLGTNRAIDTNLRYDPNDGILQSINSSIAETEKLIKKNCGYSTDEMANILKKPKD